MPARHLGSWVARVAAPSLLVLAPGAALAESASDDAIQWTAPPECPGSADVRATLERLLGRRLGRPGEALRVVGEVTRDPGDGRWHLRLSMALHAGPLKERRLDGKTCVQITDAAAVVLALAIDSEPPEAPEPPVAPAPEAPEEEPPPPRPAVWDLAAFGGVDVASLSGPAAGFGLSTGVDLGSNRVELYGAVWLERNATNPTFVGLEENLTLVVAGLRYCRWMVGGTVGLGLCGGAEAGALVGASTGTLRATTGVGPWLAPLVGLVGTVRPTPRFAVSLNADALALVFRDQYVVTGAGVVFRPPPATARVTLGVHLRFP